MGSRRRSTNGDSTSSGACPVDAGMSSGSESDAGSDFSSGTLGSSLRIGRVRATRGRSRRRRLLFESLGQRRVLAVVTGTIFHDFDESLRQEPAEAGLDSRLAYLDSNDNAALDPGEPVAITDSDGEFRFESVDPGIHSVRLFSGSTQRQTFPRGASQTALPASFTSPIDAALAGNQLNVLTDGSLLQIEVSGTRTSELPFEFNATALIGSVSNGSVGGGSASLIAGTFTELDEERSGIWLIPDGSNQPRLVHYDVDPNALIAPVAAIGSDGNGVIVVGGTSEGVPATILQLSVSAATSDADDESGINVSVNPTGVAITPNAQVLASTRAVDLPIGNPGVGSRTAFGWQINSGSAGESGAQNPSLIASLWSNTAADWIAGAQTEIEGATELVSFDDEAGLLAVRYLDGKIGILDVDAGFAPLHEFPSSSESVAALVSGQEMLASIETDDLGKRLVLQDTRLGQVLASHPIDATPIGDIIALLPGDSVDAYFLLGASGALAVELDRASEHQVLIESDDDEAEVDFGLKIDGENTPPAVPVEYLVQAVEDQVLKIAAEDIAALVSDPEQDQLISLVAEQPRNGSVKLGEDGGVEYEPDADFNGSDRFAIQFHDGRSVSEAIQFSVTVSPQPDLPSGVRFQGEGIPEHTEGPKRVGGVDVEDVDGEGNYEWSVFDTRFKIEDGSLILTEGGKLDYESESEIYLAVTGYDEEARDYFHGEIVIPVQDENDEISDVFAETHAVTENDPQAFAAYLGALDQDGSTQIITFSVDDDRFEVIGEELWLKEGESLDYEEESVVVLTLTADDNAGSTKSTEIRVPVVDVAEQIGQITLSNETVMELEPGASVGDVLLDGVAAADSYRLTVDDSRFEISGSELKLLDDQFVRRSAAEQIELTITAQDRNGVYDAISGTFVIEVLENETPFHNDENPYDVDGNGNVTPMDALRIINYLNIYGPGPVGPGDPGYGYDVNGDGQVTTLDALLIINFINNVQNGGTVGGGESPNSGQENTSGPEGEKPEVPAAPPLQEQEERFTQSSDFDSGQSGPNSTPDSPTGLIQTAHDQSPAPIAPLAQPDSGDDDEDSELARTVDELAVLFSRKK